MGRSRARAEKFSSAGIGILFILFAKCGEVSRNLSDRIRDKSRS